MNIIGVLNEVAGLATLAVVFFSFVATSSAKYFDSKRSGIPARYYKLRLLDFTDILVESMGILILGLFLPIILFRTISDFAFVGIILYYVYTALVSILSVVFVGLAWGIVMKNLMKKSVSRWKVFIRCWWTPFVTVVLLLISLDIGDELFSSVLLTTLAIYLLAIAMSIILILVLRFFGYFFLDRDLDIVVTEDEDKLYFLTIELGDKWLLMPYELKKGANKVLLFNKGEYKITDIYGMSLKTLYSVKIEAKEM